MKKNLIFSLCLLFFILNVIALLLLNIRAVINTTEGDYRLQVYLHNNLISRDVVRLTNDISDSYYICNSELDKVKFYSKDDSISSLESKFGFDINILQNLNPLRDNLSIQIVKKYRNSIDIGVIARKLESLPEIFEVDTDYELVESIDSLILNINNISYILGSVLIGTLCILFLFLIKKSIHNSSTYIKRMQLLGATNSFIYKIFNREYCMMALFAANISSIIILLVLSAINHFIEIQFLSLKFQIILLGLSLPYFLAFFIGNIWIKIILFLLLNKTKTQ